MSHPYWPQAMYGFRRQKAAPVPDAYGNYEGFGAESMMAPTRTYGSMSPKYDWATPRYIRAEPSGMGDFAGDGCVGGAKDAIASYLAEKLKHAAGYPSSCPSVFVDFAKWSVCNTKKLALDGAKVAISSAIGAALSGISGDLSDVGVRDQVHNAIASRLPGISIIGIDFDVSGTLLSLIDSAIDAGISACGSALGVGGGKTPSAPGPAGPRGGMLTCAPSYPPSTQVDGACCNQDNECYTNFCDMGDGLTADGRPVGVCRMPDLQQSGFQYKIMERLPTNLAKQQQMLIGTQPRMSLVQTAGQAAAACANNGGVMLPYDDGKTYCQPSDATMAACDAAGGTPSWDPDNGYKCPPIVPAPIVPGGSGMPGVPGVPGVPAAGGSSMMLLAGAAILAFVLLK